MSDENVPFNGNGEAVLGPGGISPERREVIRLRNAKIADALRAGERQCDVAKRFGVSKGTVNNVFRFVVKGEPKWRKGKKPGPQLRSEGATLMSAAEADLRRAQAEVLLAEAHLKEAEALCLRERALALKRRTR